MADEGPRAPARGALDGIKKDLERAKKDGGAYDPRGFGQAWTHNFLNQKPWHPMNFRNQIRRFDAEVEHEARLKREKIAKEEFAREQEHMQQMSMLGDKQREAYEARASLSFMYSKPPGLDAALAREQEEAEGGEAKRPGPDISKLGVPLGAPQVAERGPTGGGGSGDATRDEEQRRLQQHAFHDPVVSSQYVTAVGDARWELKAEREAARHAGHGGLDASHANQQLVVADEEELAAEAEEALLSRLAPQDRARVLKAKRKLKKEQQLVEAEEVLRRAGYDVGDIASGHKKKRRREEEREAGGKAGKRKAKKEKKEKKSKHKSSGREPIS